MSNSICDMKIKRVKYEFLKRVSFCSVFQIPVIALVGNDAGWTQISREQVPMFGSNVACQLAVSTKKKVFEIHVLLKKTSICIRKFHIYFLSSF